MRFATFTCLLGLGIGSWMSARPTDDERTDALTLNGPAQLAQRTANKSAKTPTGQPADRSAAWPRRSPYPPSLVIEGIAWDWETRKTAAAGSDLWPVAWGPNDHLYAAWGDGGGFGGSDSDGRVAMGFARIEGTPEDWRGVNVNGGKNPEHPASFLLKGKTTGVAFEEEWGGMGAVGEGLTCGFPQKWMSADGLRLWSIFSVYGEGAKRGINAHDRFNLVKASLRLRPQASERSYYPPPESAGGWRTLDHPEDIHRLAGADPSKLSALRDWLLQSDDRKFAAVVIRRGYIVLEVERGNSARTDARRVASVSKAICATVLAIAAEQSQQGLTPRKMRFEDRAFDFIPWAQPLSDPRKAAITVKQLLNHTSGLCPEASGAPNDGLWEYILGHTGDERTARLAFDPGTGCGYSTHALAHAALVCETVTGRPYDQFAIGALFKPLGIERWWFQYYDGGEKYGRHPSHGLGMPARDLARIAYCMLRGGRWGNQQVIPKWFVDQTAAPTHDVKTPELRWKLNPQVFSHGWELPARHWAQTGRSGEGIPADARGKPGSGGQFIAFVPSLDLVITRQTGSSGDWEFEEYLRRACATVLEPGK